VQAILRLQNSESRISQSAGFRHHKYTETRGGRMPFRASFYGQPFFNDLRKGRDIGTQFIQIDIFLGQIRLDEQ
jgi:hypothetical protein